MSLKKIIAAIVIIAIIVAGVLLIVNKNKKEKTNTPEPISIPSSITVREYEYGTNNLIKETTVESKEELEKYAKYIKEIKPLTAEEMVDLAILNQYEIIYEDITIRIQFGVKNYCFFTDSKEKVSSLSKMPEGLLELVQETFAK